MKLNETNCLILLHRLESGAIPDALSETFQPDAVEDAVEYLTAFIKKYKSLPVSTMIDWCELAVIEDCIAGSTVAAWKTLSESEMAHVEKEICLYINRNVRLPRW
jgi:hypothetical protein